MAKLKNVISSKQQLLDLSQSEIQMIRNTEEKYICVLDFYLSVIQHFIEEIPNWNRESGTKFLESLTNRTSPRKNKQTGELEGGNPNPKFPLDDVCPKFPAYLRRAVIAKAIGMSQSWYSNYKKWCKKRDNIKLKNEKRKILGKNIIKFDEHPPKYPTVGRVGITYYKGEYKELDVNSNTINLKVWNGSDWVFLTVKTNNSSHINSLHRSSSWSMKVPTLYEKSGKFYLVTSFEKKSEVITFSDYYKTKEPKVLSVDLNMGKNNRAVCSLVDKHGTVHKVKHIGLQECNTTDIRHTLGLIARQVSKLKLIPKGQTACKKLWRKLKESIDNYAHHLSKLLVDLAEEWGVRVIVFENLTKFRPEKNGKSSRNMRQRCLYWMHRRVIKYTRYKSKVRGILVGLISPVFTSQRCSLCGFQETTRPNNETLHCKPCDITHNAHINASINIGISWFEREERRSKKSA